MQKEIPVDLLALLKKLLKSWKFILLCAILFAALAQGYSIRQQQQKIRSYESFLKTYAPEKNYYTPTIAKSAEALSAVSRKKVEESVEQYWGLSRQLDTLNDCRDRLLTKTGAVCSTTLQYLVSVTDGMQEFQTADTVVADICELCAKALDSDEVIGQALTAVNWDMDPAYFRSLVSCGVDGSVFHISIETAAEDEGQAAAAVYKAAMEKVSGAIAETLSRYAPELTFAGLNTVSVPLAGTAFYADTYMPTATYLHEQITAVDSSLTDEEKTVFYDILWVKQMQELDSAGSSQLFAQSVDTLQPKKLAVGFLAGAFLACLWVCARYVFGGVVHTPRELAAGFGLYCLAELAPGAEEAGVEEACRRIRELLERKGARSLLLQSGGDSRTEEWRERLSAWLQNEGVTLGDGPASAAVLVLALEKSKYAQIQTALDEDALYERPVLGSVILS